MNQLRAAITQLQKAGAALAHEVEQTFGDNPRTVPLRTAFEDASRAVDVALGGDTRAMSTHEDKTLQALIWLTNEATGFLSMADAEAHGQTNLNCFQRCIDAARVAIRNAEADPPPAAGGTLREPGRHRQDCAYVASLHPCDDCTCGLALRSRNWHSIVGPNGMCECDVNADGMVVTCGALLAVERGTAAACSGCGVLLPERGKCPRCAVGDGPDHHHFFTRTSTHFGHCATCHARWNYWTGWKPLPNGEPYPDEGERGTAPEKWPFDILSPHRVVSAIAEVYRHRCR